MTTENINYYTAFEYNEQIKDLTQEIVGCCARIEVLIDQHKLEEHRGTLEHLVELKNKVVFNQDLLRKKEKVFTTENEADNYCNKLGETFRTFDNFITSLRGEINKKHEIN